MSVIVDMNNVRDEFPKLDLNDAMKDLDKEKIFQCDDWKYVIKRNCNTVLLKNFGNNLVSLIRIRGVIYEIVNPVLDYIEISGSRCPIHSVEKKGKSGNKTIVDIVFSTDPSCIKLHDDSNMGIFNVVFPKGFSPICYTSSKCQFQYMSCVTKAIPLLASEISPISLTLLWNSPGFCSVNVRSEGKNETLKNQIHKMEMINLEPSTVYKITVSSEEDYMDCHTITLKTPELSVNDMKKLYLSKKNEDGVYDISSIKTEYVKYMRSNGILSSEDKVNVKGELGTYPCGVVKSGETSLIEGNCNFYVVPDFDIEEEQFFCLEKLGVSHMLQFDRTESFVKYNDKIYPHKSSFKLENHTVTVEKGSIILIILEDDDPLLFPEGTVGAEQVISSGDLVVKNILCQSMSQVTEKVVGETSYGVSSFYVYDSSTSSALECTRMSHGISDDKESGSITMNVLYTNPSSVQSIVPTLETSAEKTVFSSRTTDTDKLTSTFGVDGLSFDTNEGNIFFGSGKEFRIHYEEAVGLDPAMLQIQKLSGGSYISSFIVTAEAP